MMKTLFRGRVRWVLVAWMFVICAVAFLDRVNISVAGSHIERDFKLTPVQLGWVFSAFLWGYAVFQAPGGRMSDRFGPRRVITVGTLWWATFTALTSLVPSGVAGMLAVLIAVRFLLGLGEAVILPAFNRMVAFWVPSQERGRANGWIFAGIGAGSGFAPPLSTWLLVHYEWRWAFRVCALLGLATAVVWSVIARNRPQEHPWVDPVEAEHIRSGLPERAAAAAAASWRSIFGSPQVWAITASYFAYGYAAYIYFTWFFKYLNDVRGMDLKHTAYYGMLPFLAMAVGSSVGGWISDSLARRWGKRVGRCVFGAAAMSLSGCIIALGMLAKNPYLAAVVLAGGAGTLYLAQSAFWSVSADLAGSSAGSVSGVMNMGAQIGGAVTAVLTPLIAGHFGWPASFLATTTMCLAGAAAWLLVNPSASLKTRTAPG
ncbi:MAG TPA: MFS transporter [Bryobacteraceae bacterium]|nr:MFS transporter [Bryobacteraceae bacterium]